MQKILLIQILFFSLWISACTAPTPTVTPQVVNVYSTFAAEPWLSELYDCAGTTAVLARLDDPAAAEIALRIGEPELLASPAYQIDSEEILVVTHRQSAVQNLTLEQARALFTGRGDASVQVWAYAAGEDVQEVFDRVVLQGDRIMPEARLASHPQQMSDALVSEPNSVGILPRHWKAGDSREVFSVGTVPVLAITSQEPQGILKELVACLQN